MSAVATPTRPELGSTIPALVIRLLALALAVGLSFGIVGLQLMLAVALLLSLAVIAFPRSPAAWLLAGLLALEALGSYGTAPGWKIFVVIAGAQLLHLFGMTLRWMPSTGPVQLTVLTRILRGFVTIQIPVQLVALLVLNLLANRSFFATISSPLFGILGGVGFVVLVLVIVIPVARARDRD